MQDRGTHAPERHAMAAWYAASRHHHFMESRSLGGIAMFEFFQPAGEFDKPGRDIFLQQVALRCEGHVRLDMGGDRAFASRPPPIASPSPSPARARPKTSPSKRTGSR